MDTDESFIICPACGQRVEPSDPRAIRAVALERVDAMGGATYDAGADGVFHDESCYAWAPGEWRRTGKAA